MPALQFTLTTAGKNAIVNANNTGTNPVIIDRVAIGSASWTPTAAATALQSEIKKISAIGGGTVANDTIHVTAKDASTDVYTVKEIGLYTAGNVLLAIYSQADAIITKGAQTVALIAADLVITGIPAGSITVGDATFDYPQATETVKGVAEIATTAEAQAGTDNERIITPSKLQTVTATETRKGIAEIATAAEVQAGTDTERIVTPAGLASRTATETRTGLAEVATTAETSAGTDDARMITPLKLAQRLLSIPSYAQATETSLGLVELATNAEVQGGTDTVRAVTPAGLASRTATETRAGVVELATDAEVQAQADATRAITPASLGACTATTTRKGVLEIATDAEARALAATDKIITPALLGQIPNGVAAWVSFNGQGTPAIRGEFNVSSITDLGVGKYRVNFTSSIGSLAFCALGSAATADTSQDGQRDNLVTFSPITIETSVTLWVNDPTSNTLTDSTHVFVAIISDPNL